MEKQNAFVYIVEIHNTVNSRKVVSVAKQFLHDKIYVTGNNKSYLGLRVKYETILSNSYQIWCFSTDLHRCPQYEISLKYVQWEPNRYMWTDMTKLIEAFRDSANAPKSANKHAFI